MQILSVPTFEQLVDALKGIDGRLILTGRETGGWTIGVGMAGRLMVHVAEEGAAHFYEGAAHKDAILFYMPISRLGFVHVNGHRFDEASLAVVPANGLAVVKAETAMSATMVAVPVGMLHDTQRFDSRDIALLAGSNGILKVDPRKLATLRDLILRFAANRDPLPDAGGRTAEDEFVAHILGVLELRATPSEPARGRPWVSREKILGKLRDMLAHMQDEVLYVEDLCHTVGVSERTLRVVFNETFGVGPLRYLRYRRLHLVRAALHAARPGSDTVTSIATEFGFWEFGRFAREYKALFGELPSQTLSNTWHEGVVLDRTHNLTAPGPGADRLH